MWELFNYTLIANRRLGYAIRNINKNKPPTMNSDNFWNDERVIEFTQWSLNQSPTFQGRYADIEQFKASKQKALDYEILSYNSIYKNGVWIEDEISTVKRLSDGEVFSIYDNVCWDLSQLEGQSTQPFKIKSFQINEMLPNNNRMFINNRNIDICYLRKATPKQTPLFTTEDGVVINKGDTWASVQKGTFDLLPRCIHFMGGTNWLHFSTKEAAQEFVKTNKPFMSIQDVMNRLHAYFKNPTDAIANLEQFYESKNKQQ